MDDERLRGSTTVRGFSGSLPVGDEGMLWSSIVVEVAMVDVVLFVRGGESVVLLASRG